MYKNVKRFTAVQMLFHFALIILFMLLSVTGLAWMYIETAWGQSLASPFGGYSGTLEWHRNTGLAILALFAIHIIYTVWNINWKRFPASLLDRDSIVLQWRDVKDIFLHLGWIFGLSKGPKFDRWSWWEKFVYWAVWWGLIIVGITGLMLYNPVLSSDYMPGWLLNVALWVHRIGHGPYFHHSFFHRTLASTLFPFQCNNVRG